MGLVCFSKLRGRDGLVYGPFKGEYSFSGRVVLAFWNTRLVHLGDQLFFLPLVVALKSVGIDVLVAGPTPLSVIFEGMGCRLVDFDRLYEGALDGAVVVSKHDMAPDVRRVLGKGVFFLGMNFGALEGEGRISTRILGNVSRIFQAYGFLKTTLSYDRGALLADLRGLFKRFQCGDVMKDWEVALGELGEGSCVVFNDFAASAQVQAGFRRDMLWDKVKLLREKGFKIVYVGSSDEAKVKIRVPELIDYDFRGQTSPMELFVMLMCPQVGRVLGFDTFLVHAATLVGVEWDMVVRFIRDEGMVGERFVPFF